MTNRHTGDTGQIMSHPSPGVELAETGPSWAAVE